MYLTIDQAVKRTARLTANPEFAADNLKQLAEAGTLKICFHYRGTLGVFKFPATTLPPMPETSVYFDDYLKSIAKPRLHSVVKSKNTSQVIDQLTTKAVEIASHVLPTKQAIQAIDIQPPDYWGRVRDEIICCGKVQPAMMESCPIPESKWLIDEADLDIYFLSLDPAGAVSAPQPEVETNAPAQAQPPVTTPPAAPMETITEPATLPKGETPATDWQLIPPPKRIPGYRWPLYQFLEEMHQAGKPRPTAHGVLLAWRRLPPEGMSVSGTEGRMKLNYSTQDGTPKTADKGSIQKVIDKLIL